MNLKLEAVLFDLDDTLHDDTGAYRLAAERTANDIAHEHPLDTTVLRDAYVAQVESFWQNLSDIHVRDRVVGARKQMWRNALNAVGIDDDAHAQRAADTFNRYRKEYLKLFPGTLALLADLRTRGVKTGLLTNGFAETHREKITFLGLDDAFDAIFIADEVGMVKPDPRIFLHACEQLETRPECTVMVGDRFDRDISGAQAAGLYPIWFNIREESAPAGALLPHATVYGMEALITLLCNTFQR